MAQEVNPAKVPSLKRPYAPTPFWFWNDHLDEDLIRSQVREMDGHGYGGFVIHPRLGLPRELGWMSPGLLDLMRAACEEARSCGLRVILYDEGMYPSGSSSGLVVAANSEFACRGLEARSSPELAPGEEIEASGEGIWVVSQPLGSTIRGLHWLDEHETVEEAPPASDLLNPQATACFLQLVHERYAKALGGFFGDPITGIFTDEPSLLGRGAPPGRLPGTRGIFDHALRLAGFEFRDALQELFYKADSETRRLWERAVNLRLQETFYQPMVDWCASHGLELMGHPEGPDDLTSLRRFSVPGQDLVWRWVLPGPTATQGSQSTQAKAASSSARHFGKMRNSNEFAGTYGHELTFEEFRWLGDWCIIRGQDWLIPHAVYASQRGSRRDERPPDVGWNSPWSGRLVELNSYWEGLCQLVSESRCEIRVAVLASGGACPWRAAEALFQNQIDFAYLDCDLLRSGCAGAENGTITVGQSTYSVAVFDGEGNPSLASGVSVVNAADTGWMDQVTAIAGRTLEVDRPCPSLRVRAVNGGWLAFNEGSEPLEFCAREVAKAQCAWDGQDLDLSPIRLAPFQMARLWRSSTSRAT